MIYNNNEIDTVGILLHYGIAGDMVKLWHSWREHKYIYIHNLKPQIWLRTSYMMTLRQDIRRIL